MILNQMRKAYNPLKTSSKRQSRVLSDFIVAGETFLKTLPISSRACRIHVKLRHLENHRMFFLVRHPVDTATVTETKTTKYYATIPDHVWLGR